MKKLASLGVVLLLVACGGPAPSVQSPSGAPFPAPTESNPLDA